MRLAPFREPHDPARGHSHSRLHSRHQCHVPGLNSRVCGRHAHKNASR
jgi:hypothetical protein